MTILAQASVELTSNSDLSQNGYGACLFVCLVCSVCLVCWFVVLFACFVVLLVCWFGGLLLICLFVCLLVGWFVGCFFLFLFPSLHVMRKRARSTQTQLELPQLALAEGEARSVQVGCRRTLSQASRKGHRTSSHNGSIRSDTTQSLVIAALLTQNHKPALALAFNALFCVVQRTTWILEMFFPQLQSLFISSRNVLFASGLLSQPTKLLRSGPPAASLHPQPCSFPCRSHTFIPNLLLGCLCTTLGSMHTSQHQPGDDPIFQVQCG